MKNGTAARLGLSRYRGFERGDGPAGALTTDVAAHPPRRVAIAGVEEHHACGLHSTLKREQIVGAHPRSAIDRFGSTHRSLADPCLLS